MLSSSTKAVTVIEPSDKLPNVTVPVVFRDVGVVPISMTVPPESSEYNLLLVRSNAGSPWTRSPAKGTPDPFFSLIVVAIIYSKKNEQKEKGPLLTPVEFTRRKQRG
jgi:hypothetical protein